MPNDAWIVVIKWSETPQAVKKDIKTTVMSVPNKQKMKIVGTVVESTVVIKISWGRTRDSCCKKK